MQKMMRVRRAEIEEDRNIFEEVIRNPGLEFDGTADIEEIDLSGNCVNEMNFILEPRFLSTLPSWQRALAYALAGKTIRVKDKDYKIFIIPLEEDRNAIESQKNG